jgi:hypothetical protein
MEKELICVFWEMALMECTVRFKTSDINLLISLVGSPRVTEYRDLASAGEFREQHAC